MNGINTIWFLFALLFIIGGITFLNPEWYAKIIKLNNQAKGIKTSITPQTLLVGKTLGYSMIVLGIVSILSIFLGY